MRLECWIASWDADARALLDRCGSSALPFLSLLATCGLGILPGVGGRDPSV